MLTGTNISHTRNGKTLFTNLAFILESGERLTLKGPNGSGKSTLLRILAGLIPLTKGTVCWEEKPISKANLNDYQQNLLYVGHKLGLHPQARVRDQMQLWKTAHQVPVNAIEKALKNWGLDGHLDTPITHLSHGQQKRLCLTRCHWLNRRLWLLDEPEAGLDAAGHSMLEQTLSEHLARGGCIVHATHGVGEHLNSVISAKAGIQTPTALSLDPRLRGDDAVWESPLP